MDSRRILFYAACLALVTSAFSFQMRANVNDQWAFDFVLTKEVVGTVMAAAFLGMAVSMLIFSPLAEIVGLGTIMVLAWICHLTGILGTLFSQQLAEIGAFQTIASGVDGVTHFTFGWFLGGLPEQGTGSDGYWILFLSTFLVGCGNGLTEVWINPLAASLYPNEKTHKLNVLHAWWPGGLMIAGLLALFVINPILDFNPAAEGIAQKANAEVVPPVEGAPVPEAAEEVNADGEEPLTPNDPETRTLSWRVKIAMLGIPLLLYGALCIGRRFPKTERVEAEVPLSTAFMQLIRPLFLVLAFCMLLTAATELGVNNWQESVLTRTAGVSGTLVFIYTSAIMFGMRFFAGHIVERISPIVLMLLSSVLTAAGLYALSYANEFWSAFGAATLFGIGIAYFWPTMLGITAERFPKGGALIIGLIGCFANLSIAFALPEIGKVYDSYTVHNLPSHLQDERFLMTDGELAPIVMEPEQQTGSLFPAKVQEFLYPEGGRKLNPGLTPELREQFAEETRTSIAQAEAQGAAYAYRRLAILPAFLIVVFGLIALIDWARGGYRRLATKEKLG